MSNHDDQNRTDGVDKQSKQFAETDELYAANKDYSREAEASQELTANEFNRAVETEQGTSMQTDVNTVYGWIGLILSIASFFVWPLLMAIGGIVLGFISKKKGADTLGNSAIVISIISLLLSLIFVPLF